MKYVVEIDLDALSDNALVVAKIMSVLTQQLYGAAGHGLKAVAEHNGTKVLAEGSARKLDGKIVYREQLVDEPFDSERHIPDGVKAFGYGV